MKACQATEVVEFKLVDGVSDEEFLKKMEFLEENFHSKQSGFVKTELAKGVGGLWVIIQHWETMEEMKEASKLMTKDSITEDFRNTLDHTSIKLKYLESIRTWK